MRRLIAIAAAGGVVVAAGGCSSLPAWQAPADAKTVQVTLPERGHVSACIADKPYRLEPDAKGNVSLPVDERVTLWTFLAWSGSFVNFSCYPATSFVPRAGQGYTMVLEVEPENQSCTFRPYRQTTANRTGLDFEPSIGPAVAYACKKP